MNVRRRKLLLPLIPLVPLTLALAACGSDADGGDDVASLSDADGASTASSPSSSDGTSDEAVDPQQAMLDFAECMREQGIDMPDPEFTEDGGVMFRAGGVGDDGSPSLSDRAAMEEAHEACQQHLANAPMAADREGFDPTEMEDQMLEFTQCMRDEGVDMPDPDFSDDGDGTFEAPDPGESSGPMIAGPFGTLDLGDPDVAAAFEGCGDIVGGGPGAAPLDADGGVTDGDGADG
jgi:hypothetical protein